MFKKHFMLALIGLLASSSAFSAEPSVPGVVKMQDLMAAAKGSAKNSGAASLKKGELCMRHFTGAFRCDSIGVVSIPEIYAAGWRVVAMSNPSEASTLIVIEEQ